jgi:hypothetical protein
MTGRLNNFLNIVPVAGEGEVFGLGDDLDGMDEEAVCFVSGVFLFFFCLLIFFLFVC